jgi:nucleotide-binding universal stress UspA family protein
MMERKMAYKTILVCLNETSRLPQIISAARQLGVKYQAHITGLYVIPGVEVYPVGIDAVGVGYNDVNRRFYQDKLKQVRAEFEAAMKKDGLSFDFHEVDALSSQISREVAQEARAVDLMVVSATSKEDSLGVERDFVETLVIAAGRPVLVLPFKGEALPNMDEVILGWDDSRESSRAAFDALPFLLTSKRVNIVTVDAAPRGMMPGAAIAEALDRHGIKTTTTNVSSDGLGIGETLLRSARDEGAGLIVMGAYGHSRFTEFVFGGATRDIIKRLDRPVLMSH